MRIHLTRFDDHQEQQRRFVNGFDDSVLSVSAKVLTTLAIVMAAVAIAILVNVLNVY
ncbi:MAG TPA: hypothetical protein VH933_10730 [Aestuariivirgaceae bacterium]|jgi:hypothetical protein